MEKSYSPSAYFTIIGHHTSTGNSNAHYAALNMIMIKLATAVLAKEGIFALARNVHHHSQRICGEPDAQLILLP